MFYTCIHSAHPCAQQRQSLLADLYEKDPVIKANFNHIPDIATGWYELVVNLTLPQSSSPYLAAGAPCVKVEWAKVPLDEACQPLHIHQKNRIALFSTKVGRARGDEWVDLEVVTVVSGRVWFNVQNGSS